MFEFEGNSNYFLVFDCFEDIGLFENLIELINYIFALIMIDLLLCNNCLN
jgi:hypothetical protein